MLDGPLGQGAVVHEWYADGVDPDSLLLGASMTKSVLAHLVGNAIASGALRLEDAVTEHVPELAGSGYAGCTVEHVLTMTTGTAWVEDHRDPSGPATRLIACFAGDGRQLARPAGRGRSRWTRPARGGSTTPPTRRCSTGSASAPPARTYAEALTELWGVLGCVRDAVVGVDTDGVAAGRRRAGRLRRGLAAAGGAPAHRHGVRRPGARPRLGAALLDSPVTVDGARPAAQLDHHARRASATTGGRSTTDGVRVTSDGSRGQFGYVDRDLGVAVLKTSLWPYDDFLVDRQQRDLSYLGLPLVAAAARTGP